MNMQKRPTSFGYQENTTAFHKTAASYMAYGHVFLLHNPFSGNLMCPLNYPQKNCHPSYTGIIQFILRIVLLKASVT
jgi:hypothetical protein